MVFIMDSPETGANYTDERARTEIHLTARCGSLLLLSGVSAQQ